MNLYVVSKTSAASTCAMVVLGMCGCGTATNSTEGVAGSRSGFFPPLIYPSGEGRPYWRAGLGTRRLESVSDLRKLDDGSRIFTITCEAQPPLYIWDRISPQYNSPAVASQYSNFWTYATLDIENLAFLENIHTQLLRIMPKPRSAEHNRLIRKLSDAIHDARRSTDGH